MNKPSSPLSGITILSAAVCSVAFTTVNVTYAEEAHLHGAASMEVVVDSGALEIRLVSPAESIVGFEHEPESDAEKEAVNAANTYLLNGAEIFQFADAGCEMKESETDFGHLIESDHSDDEEHHEADGHHADDEQADSDEHADDDHDEHSDHADEGDTHSDIEATYHFSCEPDKSVQFDVGLFDRFSGLESIQVRWITTSGQGHTQLSSSETTVQLGSE